MNKTYDFGQKNKISILNTASLQLGTGVYVGSTVVQFCWCGSKWWIAFFIVLILLLLTLRSIQN